MRDGADQFDLESLLELADFDPLDQLPDELQRLGPVIGIAQR